MKSRRELRLQRWRRARRVRGTAERPRLVVDRGLRSIQAHFVNDDDSAVICGASTLAKSLEIHGSNIEAAKALGKELARRAKEKGITKVVFDRNGYPYHGRVKALADGAREGGLEF
ncbi:MAG TPA: 50S ribosomal protein L18 [Firmicutes bacterium]|nr:50S ribosomal protein L18 [Bacillota bacterium]